METQGSRQVFPTQAITYRMVAHGKRQQVESVVQINVTVPQPTLSVNVRPQIIQEGQSAELTWSSQNAQELILSPGNRRLNPTGSLLVYPRESTTYQVIARGEGGVVASQDTVNVAQTIEIPPPTITTSAPLVPLTIPAGTLLTVRLVDAVNSGVNHAGDVFRATLDQPIATDGKGVLPKYAELLGRVQQAVPSGRVSGVAQLSLVLYQVKVAGQAYTVYTDPLQLAAKSERAKDAAKVGIGAAIGAAIGAIAGGGKGAATGAGVGAGAGTGVVLATKGQELALGPETLLTFRLGQNVTIRQMQ
jgi:hypothetical protein